MERPGSREAVSSIEGQTEGQREALPELELRQLVRSEQPINKEGGTRKNIEALKPWNNYTIVILKGSKDIKIYDEDGHQVEDFSPPLSSNKLSINWREQSSKFGGKRYIATDDAVNSGKVPADNNIKVSELPLILRALAKTKIGDGEYFDATDNIIETYPASLVEVTPEAKYIVLYDNGGGYFAFVTRNEQGVELAPRNWKRIDASDTIPTELYEYAQRTLGEHEGYRQFNEKYSAFITDVGINIVRNDETTGKPVFSDRLPSVERNITVDPNNPNIIYYCQSSNPKTIMRLDLSDDPNKWVPVPAEFPKKYDSISNLQLDPSGNFFLFYSKDDLVIITKDGLEEVKRVPNLTQVNFDSQGRIRAIDKDGHLVIYEPNFGQLAEGMDKRRVARLAEEIQIQDIFSLQAAKKVEQKKDGLHYLEPLKVKYQEQFADVLSKVTTQEGVHQIRQGFKKLIEALMTQGLKQNEVAFIVEGLEEPIIVKEKEFAAREATAVLASASTKLSGALSIAVIGEARTEVERLKATEALLDDDLRRQFREIVLDLEQKSLEFFHQRGDEVIKDVKGLLARTKTDLEEFTSKAQIDDWLEFRFPQLKSRLGSLASDVPLEADEAYKAIIGARTELQGLATLYEEKFKREYAKVREKAVERTEAVTDTLKSDIAGLVERLRSKGFADRRAAEMYLESSEARKAIEGEINALSKNNPEAAKELSKALQVKISNALTEVERGGMTKVAETGQQMILFGSTFFPKWEAKVKEKTARQVDLVFEEDAKTRGPGVTAGKIFGDVSLNIKGSTGEVQKVRLYEGWRDENEWRLGLLSYRGEALEPSYVTAAEYKSIKKDYADWMLGQKSEIQREFEDKRKELSDLYGKRQKIGKRGEEDESWKNQYKEKLKEYAEFVAKHHIPILRRIDRVKSEPELEFSNGRGFVPEWQNHWVSDPQTERDLEDMARGFKMQLDLQEGVLNLKGHAGTGKDVRIKMFCALTNRTYFPTDGTKWTTEFELSEDVMLESKDGASQTVKVPSTVLNGITTPGAVVYFNEFNAMPEQAQIFLHALMDEKRSLTLKTSSGKVIKAHPSVLLASSMNPGYPGTFDPQFATRSRLLSIEIGYPPLTRALEKNDKNPNPPYDTSEALRVAREVDSLSDLTYEASLERNEFVALWDKYVNGIENGAPQPTVTQKFDIDTILALVQFANKLRENFIKIFEKSRDARNALPVTQPVTGRELRRCAYALNEITPEAKATADSEALARKLLDQYFLINIDKKEDKDKIRTAMNTWTSKKRVKA